MRFSVFGFRFSDKRLLAVGLALAVLGMGAASEVGAEGLQARLVNKRPVGEQGPVSFYVGQVEVTLADGTKKLLPHWSYMEPRVAGDRVFILPTQGVKLSRVFVYDAKTGKISKFRFPFDMDLYFGSPSFSPDGTKIAYYVKKGKVVVRAWPSLKLLMQSDQHPVRPTDLPPMPPVWTSPTKVHFDPLFFQPERQLTFSLSQ